MIVINFPYYAPVNANVNRIIASRDKITNATNLYVKYADSTVKPKQYKLNGVLTDNTTDKWFDLSLSNTTNPREIYNDQTDKWKLDKRNYILIDRYNPAVADADLGYAFEYVDGGDTYRFRIDDETEIRIKTNIISVGGVTESVIGTSVSEMQVVDMSNYMVVTADDISASGKDPASYQTWLCKASIPTPTNLVYTQTNGDGDKVIKTGGLVSIQYSQFKNEASEPICISEVVTDNETLYHWASCAALPDSKSGILGHNVFTVNNNIMFQLNYNQYYNPVDPSTAYKWDYAVVSLTKPDEYLLLPSEAYSGLESVGYQTVNDPVVYVTHKDILEDGTIVEVGTTRLGFINQTTQVIIGHTTKVVGEETIHAFDEVFVVGGSSSAWVDFGLVDVKYYTEIAKFEAEMAL
ncbi:hypothetical protein HNP86_001907 [Methanococcus maripaludis]|uniref:Uncharacterized protein n=1 Tax=Methanococcus maripaludis TaxID=39152 RepID=A0A7J9NVP0_METMI|nr:hypothetical protein [Methanococcus maripaludis]MBA2851748.1 hypothetical protein [Methanococcus maripaludis]